MNRPPTRIFQLNHKRFKTARAIQRLSIASYKEEARILGVTDFLPLKRTISDIRGARGNFYGYSHQGTLAAAGELEEYRTVNTIVSLTVHPRFFRKGIGTKLLQYLIELSKGRKIEVSTASGNAPAIALYKKHGFRLMRKKTEGKFVIVTLCRARDKN